MADTDTNTNTSTSADTKTNKKTKPKSIAQDINNSKTMLAGLTANADILSKWGISAEFLTQYKTEYDEVRTTHSEQAALMSRSKEKTSDLLAKKQAMQLSYQNAKRIVKMQLPQDSWKEFGISDKR